MYDESLVAGAGGAPPAGASSSGGGAGTGGGAPRCATPVECPGEEGECRKRTCVDGACGLEDAPAGTPLAQQTRGDCRERQCDGRGGVMEAASDADADDGDPCTDDTCASGEASHVPVAVSSPCGPAGDRFCNAAGACVECVEDAQCEDGRCTSAFECAVDPCRDGARNGGETDIDCGGAECPQCAVGATCAAPTDCQTANCGPDGVCGREIVISEVRSRGLGGAGDDFVELYNATSGPVVLDDRWKIEARSASGAIYTVRWTGGGATVPSHGHYLIAGTAYVQAPAPDAPLSAGITDAASIRLLHGAETVDALCYYNDAASQAALHPPEFSCEGAPVQNAAGAADTDGSLERRPGGALGNGVDTGANQSDFQATTSANPQSTASAATP